MSERLQYEMHLDADQLNAFAEGVLPAQLREETLAHLAVCPVCREILSLSLPPMENVAQSEPVLARKPWFSGWNVLWPVAVLAALTVVALSLRTRTVAERKADGVQQAEGLTRPVFPTARPQEAPTEGEGAVRSTPSKKVDAGSARNREARTEVASQEPSVMTAQDAETLPRQGRNVTEALKSLGGVPAEKKQLSPHPTTVTMGSGSPSPRPATAESVVVEHSVQGVALGSAQGMAGGAGGGTMTNNAAVASEPAQVTLGNSGQPRNVNQTVTVDVQAAGSEITTSDAAAAGMIQQASVATLRSLPSGLAAISVATVERHVVAIDLHNNVYFSKNDGKRWKTVAVPWQGRAVKVGLAASGVAFELTTDHDGVWVSADGRNWVRKSS